MSEQERQKVLDVIINAGYKSINPKNIIKLPNEWNNDVYVIAAGEGIVIYIPKTNTIKYISLFG